MREGEEQRKRKEATREEEEKGEGLLMPWTRERGDGGEGGRGKEGV